MVNIATNEEYRVLVEEADALRAQGWDDHGLFKDDPEALKLFDEIEEERDRWSVRANMSDLSLTVEDIVHYTGVAECG